MKSLMMKAAVLAVALFLPQETNEAEELFRKMEEKLVAAKTIHLKTEGIIEPVKLKLTGELWLDGENRARMELAGRTEEENRSAVVISDGRTVRKAQDETARSIAASEEYGHHVRTCFARFGFVGMIDYWDTTTLDDPLKKHHHYDFKLGAKEKVGEREAQVVEFRIGAEAAATLWIDVKTHLPLKRTVTKGPRPFEKMGEVTVIRELYTEIKLDEKIDPAKFELSKEKK